MGANDNGRHANGYFKKGTGGRVPGSRNKLQKVFVDELAKDFEENGAGAIRIVRVEKPAEYLRIVASVLPKELLVAEASLGDLSDEEILEALAEIRKAKASVVVGNA